MKANCPCGGPCHGLGACGHASNCGCAQCQCEKCAAERKAYFEGYDNGRKVTTREMLVSVAGGKLYLTLVGFNELRRLAGLDPIKPARGESIADFKFRANEARKEFFRKFQTMGELDFEPWKEI